MSICSFLSFSNRHELSQEIPVSRDSLPVRLFPSPRSASTTESMVEVDLEEEAFEMPDVEDLRAFLGYSPSASGVSSSLSSDSLSPRSPKPLSPDVAQRTHHMISNQLKVTKLDLAIYRERLSEKGPKLCDRCSQQLDTPRYESEELTSKTRKSWVCAFG